MFTIWILITLIPDRSNKTEIKIQEVFQIFQFIRSITVLNSQETKYSNELIIQAKETVSKNASLFAEPAFTQASTIFNANKKLMRLGNVVEEDYGEDEKRDSVKDDVQLINSTSLPSIPLLLEAADKIKKLAYDINEIETQPVDLTKSNKIKNRKHQNAVAKIFPEL